MVSGQGSGQIMLGLARSGKSQVKSVPTSYPDIPGSCM